METTEIQVPDGIRYLSDWTMEKGCKDSLFDDVLPHGQHYILNKSVCGCGATEAVLGRPENIILIEFRKVLLYSKFSKHQDGSCWLYRFISRDQFFSTKRPSQTEQQKFDDMLIEKIGDGCTKILTTPDSFPRLVRVLKKNGIDLKDYKVVVDEMQAILMDAVMKVDTEETFLQELNQFNDVMYLSATPLLDEELDQMAHFKDMPLYRLVWPDNMIVRNHIRSVNLNGSIIDKCVEIVREYRNGQGYEVVEDGKTYRAEEAVTYLNDVRSIMSVVKKADLRPDEVCIICSPADDNQKNLEKLGQDMTRKFGEKVEYKIGDVPSQDNHKKFTFCTSTAYMGSDFMQESAMTYIFANSHVKSLTMDIATDLQQVMGRQRLDSNPFKNHAVFYYILSQPLMTEAEHEAQIQKRKDESERMLRIYNGLTDEDCKATQLNLTEKSAGIAGNNYCVMIKDDNGNNVSFKMSNIAEVAERRAYKIASRVYSGDFSLYEALSQNASVTRDVDSNIDEVRNLFVQWKALGNQKDQLKFYCDVRKDNPEIIPECHFFPRYFSNWYDALGEEGMKDLNWRGDKIKLAVAPLPFDEIPHYDVAARLLSMITIPHEYTRKEAKEMMLDIYKELGIKGAPSASDMGRYVTIRESNRRIGGKVTQLIGVTSPYRTGISLFNRIDEPANPMKKNYSVDEVLEIVRQGKVFNLKNKVGKVREAYRTDKEKGDKLKRTLPVAAWNGTFTYRDANGCSQYSSFTALDFDKVQDEEGLKKLLESTPCVYAYFRTPSGNGYKAIILHDNYQPAFHYDLYEKLLKHFNHTDSDTSTRDLGRGNYLSYDPDLWKNPNPQPFHFIPSTTKPLRSNTVRVQTVVKDASGNNKLQDLDELTSDLLLSLEKQLMTDEAVMEKLEKRWTRANVHDKGGNNTALTYGSVTCRAGIELGKAIPFIRRIIQGAKQGLTDGEIERAVKNAYKYNQGLYGSNRRKYRGKKRTP